MSNATELNGTLGSNSARGILEQSLAMRPQEKLPRTDTKQLALGMAQHLDEYVTRIAEVSGIKDGELTESRDFFVRTTEYGITPIERIAVIYETLTPPTDENERETFELARSLHAQELIERAFDQHRENPQQYVSHGFDHTINVADNVQDITGKESTGFLAAICNKYGITEGDAKFIAQIITFYHDFGYPYLEKGDKAFHSIPGAEMISSENMTGLHFLLMTSLKNKAVEDTGLLFDDMRDAVSHHGADKIEEEFAAVISIPTGIFLLKNPDDVNEALTKLYSPEFIRQHGHLPPSIIARDQGGYESILKAGGLRIGRRLIIPKVTLEEGPLLKGRNVASGNGINLGLEYQVVDSATSPLLTLLRLADNMDITTKRLTEIQRDEAFQEICRVFGDNGQDSLRLQELERAVIANSESMDTEIAWKTGVIDRILAKPEHSDRLQARPAFLRKIREIALKISSETLRHFGGCEAIKDIAIAGPVVKVTVDGETFSRLNNIRVSEKTLRQEDIEIGVGEYQIWRMQQAYKSVTVEGQPVQVQVYNEDGNRVVLTTAI